MDYNNLLQTAQMKTNQILARTSSVLAVIVAGSLAQGNVDKASDVDLIVYYDGDIPDSIQAWEQEEVKVTGGEIRFASPKTLVVVHYINGVRTEVAHVQQGDSEAVMKKVLEDHNVEPVNHLVVTGIATSLPLHDAHGLLERWKSRLADYPEPLAEALIKHNLELYSKPILLQMGVEREDWLFLAEAKLKTLERLIGILCGLNRMYHPGKLKRIAATLNRMGVRPEHVMERFNKVVQLERGVELVTQLVYDTFDLVDKHMPAVSTLEARAKYEVIW